MQDDRERERTMNMAGAPLSLRYHSDQLSNKVVSLLKEFYVTGEFCDIVLHVGSIEIHAHRIVLAAFSPYFRELFHQPSSQNCGEITLRSHLKEEAVRQLVDFCYSSDITVDSQSADKILTAANFLQIKEVEKLCITFLAAQQALKPEGGLPPAPTASVSITIPPVSPTQDKLLKGDHSRELACADTSGIGSNNTSPRQSSRPGSVPSGNGSITAPPLEDTDVEVIEVKKEREDHCPDPTYMSLRSSSELWRPPSDYETMRSTLSTYPGFYFPPLSGALTLPTTRSHHLLMKALSQSAVPAPTEMRDLGEMYLGKLSSAAASQVKAEDLSKEGSSSDNTTEQHQCHICLKFFQNVSSLKSHLADHQDVLSVPAASPYKMSSPVRKSSSQSSLYQSTLSQVKKEEEFSGSNMCGTCGKSFRDPQSLKFHRYNHVLRYQCNYCGKRFSRSWNLHRHRKTHYRQMLEGAISNDDGSVIEVDDDKSDGASYTAEKSYDLDKSANYGMDKSPGTYDADKTSAYDIEKSASNNNNNINNNNIDKEKILASPYVDYRNHRHDMMPFAFDFMRAGTSSMYGLDKDKRTVENHESRVEKDSEDDMSDSEERRRYTGQSVAEQHVTMETQAVKKHIKETETEDVSP